MKKAKTAKKSINPLVFVGIGVLALLVIGGAIAMKFFARQIGTGMVEKAIESKTGMKANIRDLEEGKMTFTDSETGTTVDVGTGKIPDAFPKDFPLYPKATVTSSLSGSATGSESGFWLTLTTPDAAQNVLSFYKTELGKAGWSVKSTFTANDMTNQTVEKGTWQGSLSVGKDSSDGTTQIVIILSEET